MLSSTLALAQLKTAPLLLEDILKTVNKSYPQICAARLRVKKAQGNYIKALGQFDPTLKSNSRSFPAGGYISNYSDSEISIPTLANGLRLFAGYRLGLGEWQTYYENYLTNSEGEYRAGVALPLLKDRLIDEERTKLLSAVQKVDLQIQDVAATKLNVYHETIKFYWLWVKTGLQLQIFEELLRIAEDRQAALVKQEAQGAIPRLAIIENNQMIMQRKQLVNQGAMVFEQAGINLSIYYRDRHGHPKIPAKNELPTQAYLNQRLLKPTIDATQRNLPYHPALLKLEKYYHITKIKWNLAKNNLLPNLDATAYTSKQYGVNGYPLMLPQAAFVGMRFKFPIFQREAKGQLISSTNELKRIITEKRFLFEQLNNQFSNLLVGLKTYRYQIKLVDQELSLAKQVQDGESKKFYAGDSPIFMVNQREQATTQILLTLINARVNYQETNALIRFFVSTDGRVKKDLALDSALRARSRLFKN